MLDAIRHAAVWFEPTMDGLDLLLESIGETRALEPLETWSIDEADLPETYPTAL